MLEVVESIGYCIYCGIRTGPLSDEHVVPYSLGGGVTLPDASCPACATITSRFEGLIARRHLGPFRIRADLPTRRPRDRPNTLTLKLLDKGGVKRSVEIDAGEHPGTLLLPDLPEPSLLVPTLKGPRRSFRMYVALPDSRVFELAKKFGADAFGLGTFEIGSYYLLLAKVAHAGAFAYPGDWTLVWEPLLPEFIVGKREDYECLVGGTGAQEFASHDGSFPVFHRTVAVNGEMFLVAFFRLFSENETPTYQVVVGRRRATVTLAALQRVHPEGLSALALNLENVKECLREASRRGHAESDVHVRLTQAD